MEALLITMGVVVVLVALNAFFSLAETALTAASRGRMASLEREGDRLAARVNRLNEDREGLIGAVLLGANLVTIGASAIATTMFTREYGDAGAVIATAVLTPLLLIFGEVLPKSLAITSADAIARRVALPVQFMVTILRPVMYVLTGVVRFLLRLIGIKAAVVDTQAALEEIRGAVELGAQEGHLEKVDRDRLGGVLDLEELDVSEVMIHRQAIKALDAGLPVSELIAQAVNLPHSRVPVYEGDPENIIGILYNRDILSALVVARGDMSAIQLSSIIREPKFIPDTTTLKEQLENFLKERSHFALVVDEYGALQGLVTLEDILEEIVGDIMDEHDVAVQGVRPMPDGSVFVDGWVPVRDLNRAMDWELPDEEAVTVAGLVMHESQTIPEIGQEFSFHGHRFHVMRKERNQIKALRVAPDKVGKASDAAQASG
jgi:Mg2+/Co2+ transporter CorB